MGSDTADFSEKTTSVAVALSTSTTTIATVTGVTEDTMVNIENATGGLAADQSIGSSAANKVVGNAGAGTLHGVSGKDTLTGGLDADSFKFSTSPSSLNRDLITDLSSTQGDRPSFAKSVHAEFGLNTTLTGFQFSSGADLTAAATTDQRFIYDTNTGMPRFYLDGSSALASALEVVQLGTPNHPSLTAASFVLN